MDELPELKDFETCLNNQFAVELSDRSIYPLVLVEATPLPRAHAVGQRNVPFQLKFHGPGPGYLPQQIHPLQHDRLGCFQLFLVPVGQDSDGFLYQAVFN